ncbi:rhomboid family intramembrane serine protease [Aquimarina sp. M1]
MATGSLSYQWKTANISIKIIAVNALIFLIARLGAWILKIQPGGLMEWFVLPADFSNLILQVWGIVTYSFLHFDFWHIFWNMLMLYWFSQFVLNLFTEKRFLTIYLLGAISGGLLFVLAYNFFPVFEGQRGYLIGASAAVLAVVVFIATYAPYTQIRIFMFTLKVWHIALFMVLGDIIRLSSSSETQDVIANNSGGLIAHLGGALFGYLYASQLKKGKDIGSWFEKLMDSTVSIFKTRKKSPLKTVHRAKKAKTTTNKKTTSPKPKTPNQAEIDAILDKISKSGYDSLTKKEKDFLFKAGKD